MLVLNSLGFRTLAVKALFTKSARALFILDLLLAPWPEPKMHLRKKNPLLKCKLNLMRIIKDFIANHLTITNNNVFRINRSYQ